MDLTHFLVVFGGAVAPGTGPITPGSSTPGGGGSGGFGSGGSPVPVWQPVSIYKTFQFIVTGVSTTIIEGSNDPRVATSNSSNAVWITLTDSITGSPISATASVGFENSFPWKYVRANNTSFTSGTVLVYMGT